MNEEFNKFLDEVKEEQPKNLEDALGIKEQTPAPEEGEKEDKEEEPRKNRRHRRWDERLTEREKELIAREARIAALEEAKTNELLKESGDIDPRLLQLYGNEEQGKAAAALTQQLLRDTAAQAKSEALKEFEESVWAEQAEVKQFESYLDEQFEALEDQHDVDLTSNAPAARKARNEMLSLLERISPKDADGNITEYADIEGVYEIYQSTRQKENTTNDRQKELSSRTQVKTGTAPEQKPQTTSGFRGWMKDYGL